MDGWMRQRFHIGFFELQDLLASIGLGVRVLDRSRGLMGRMPPWHHVSFRRVGKSAELVSTRQK